MLYLLLMGLVTIAGGLLQGVSGFGGGVAIMLFLPHLLPVNEAAAVSGTVCFVFCLVMIIKYHKFMRPKKVLAPAVLYFAASGSAIFFSKMIDPVLMKHIFGAFLILLAAYNLLNKKSSTGKISRPVGAVFIIISGICDGLFGIGGPLMVLYFLSCTESVQEYLGNIQLLFLANNFYMTLVRIGNGILTPADFPWWIVGAAGMLVGFALSVKVVDRVNAESLKKITYIAVAVTGLLNVF